MTEIGIVIFLFVLGAGVGSFVSATVGRMRQGRGLGGRSRCSKCDHELGAVELLPIVGWLILRGKCRKCRQKIGVEPLLAEIATACFFVSSYQFWPLTEANVLVSGVLFGMWLVILSGLIFLLIYDAKYQVLPNRVIYPVIAFSAIFWLISSVTNEQNICSMVLDLTYSMLPVAGIYGLIFVLSRGKLVGLGDVKLGVIIGFLLPWWGALAVLGLANIMAFLIIAIWFAAHKSTRRHIAFGPFLIVATLVFFFVMKFFVDFF
jgi:leader peptidase (prepilin peptidase)/N-methyltransferase